MGYTRPLLQSLIPTTLSRDFDFFPRGLFVFGLVGGVSIFFSMIPSVASAQEPSILSNDFC